MKNIRHHEFRGVRYHLKWERPDRYIDGECDTRQAKNPEIMINPNISEEDFLDTVIHESLHACLEDLDEESVAETANAISSLLVKMGYKRL